LADSGVQIKQLKKGAYSYGDSSGFPPDSLLMAQGRQPITVANISAENSKSAFFLLHHFDKVFNMTVHEF
jgi:hypothetical protein